MEWAFLLRIPTKSSCAMGGNGCWHTWKFALCGIAFFCTFQRSLFANKNQRDSVEIKSQVNLNVVTILGDQPVVRNNEYEFGTAQAKSLVTLLGGTDVMRYIGTLPGVSQGMEGGLGYFVRGGNGSNNRVELDQVPIYGSTHLFGLFSVFHPDMVASVDFRTGSLSAATGDYLASLTRITSLTPDSVYHAKGSLSPFFAGLSASGPISKRWRFVSAGRISFMRQEYLAISKLADVSADVNPQVGDLYLKLQARLGEKHSLSVSGFYSNDYLGYADASEMALNWGNNFFRAAWEWRLSSHLKLSTWVYGYQFFSRQQQRYYDDDGLFSSELRLETKLEEAVAQSHVLYQNNHLILNGGLSAKKSLFHPASEKVLSGSGSVNTFEDNPASELYAFFGEMKYEYKHVLASLGFRSGVYFMKKKSDFPVDLHASVSWRIRDAVGLESSFDRMHQVHHALEGLPMGWSLDLLIPADADFKPEQSDQFYVGVFGKIQSVTVSSGVYHKRLTHLVSYKNASNVFGVQNTSWREEVAIGKGESYGLEARIERKGMDWNGACSYTLSKTTRQFDAINGGKVFPFKFDRRHVLNAQSQWVVRRKKNKEQSVSLSAAYSSGHWVTLQTGTYKGVTPPYWDLIYDGSLNSSMDKNAYYRQLMSEANGYQMPDYFRLDVGYSFRRIGRRFTREWTLGVYNVLNRKNPYLVFYENGGWKQLSIFPIIPSVEWTLSF
jgi:hypothetical protein